MSLVDKQPEIRSVEAVRDAVRDMRLVLVDPNGVLLDNNGGNIYYGIENTNTQACYAVSAQIMCDLNHWHEIGRTPLPPWMP
jgi:hypothetical protein